MKFIKRDNAYYNSTKSNKVNVDTFEAWSYGWWKYATIYNGIKIFNNYTYSATTAKHQSDARSLFNYNYDLVLQYTDKSLDTPVNALRDEIECLRNESKNLLTLIKKPRTQKKKNAKRALQITQNAKTIQKLKELLQKGNVVVNFDAFDKAFTEMECILYGIRYDESQGISA